ncbi:MAG: UDPGP type 1 family protein [Puniceicoccales bacterium]|jgi:UDP-N-acetylglucosamine/UDP-N-acetylgalactosamine diphosphorylase|nr:UDPGP type 1 family protein [Puniceicoccales bacterium]
MEAVERELLEKFSYYGQDHVFRFLNDLNSTERADLLCQAKGINLHKLSGKIRTLLALNNGFIGLHFKDVATQVNFIGLPNNDTDEKKWAEAYHIGEKALGEGRIAVLTAAGGQGSRLGRASPKGMLKVTPVNGKTLFQVFAEKIRFAEKKYGHKIHWFIMTSDRNRNEIIKFFYENDSFGLAHVHFFNQGSLPAVDFSGKIMMEEKHRIAMHPDGHGGVFGAFVNSGLLDILDENDIDMISYFQVDNPLVRCIDPHFVGFHIKQQSQMSCRMVTKTYPEEKIGVFCTMYDKTAIIEYSDLSAELAGEKDITGRLRFRAGNAAIHIFDRDFVKAIGDENALKQLQVHMAKKRIPTIDANGNYIEPESVNGVKFETFVFDALQFAQRSLVLEADRRENFSPIKNLHGTDSLATCKQNQLRLFARWLLAGGAEIPVDATGLPPFNIEISPLFAENKVDFLLKWNALKVKPAISANSYIS